MKTVEQIAKETATLAARALRAIPSERRSQASRDNGKRGGRPQGCPVRVLPTTEAGFGDAIGQECPVLRDRAASRTGAIRAARRAGYRVLTRGGCIELHEPEGGPSEWWVSVHPHGI